MKRLTHHQMRSLLTGISKLHASDDPEGLPERLFAAVRRVVTADHLNLTVWDKGRIKLDNPAEFPIVAMHAHPHISVTPAMVETYNHFFHEEPFKKPFYRNGLTSPTRISDIMPDSCYHRLDIYNEHFRKIGVDRSMAVALESDDDSVMVSLSVARDKREFTDAEAAAMAALRPHVIAARRASETLADLRHEQALYRRALEESERGIIFLDTRSGPARARHMTRRAGGLLAKYFAGTPTVTGGRDKLPDAIARWVAHRERRRTGEDAAAHVPDLEAKWGATTLRVSALGDDGEGREILLLNESPQPTLSNAAVETYGLTGRETEILEWVARGRTNAEVAELCDISARTVQKHLEHIFQKLGVETRTAAARFMNYKVPGRTSD